MILRIGASIAIETQIGGHINRGCGAVFAAFEDPNFAPPNGKLYMQRRKDGK